MYRLRTYIPEGGLLTKFAMRSDTEGFFGVSALLNRQRKRTTTWVGLILAPHLARGGPIFWLAQRGPRLLRGTRRLGSLLNAIITHIYFRGGKQSAKAA